MVTAYGSPREHLEELVGLVGQLVERQIVAHWELGLLPRVKDEFSGTFVSGSEVQALMAGGFHPSDEGQSKLAELDQAIAARAEAIEARLARSRDDGQPMPFDHLRATFGLSATEQRALAVLVAVETSQRLRQLMRYLVNEANRVHADVGLLELLVYSARETRDRLVYELGPDAPLFRYRLLEPVGRAQGDDAPWLLRAMRVNRRVLELLHGAVRLDREIARVAELIESPPSSDTLLIDDTLKTEVTELLRAAVTAAASATTAPAVVLSGNEGAGRKSLICGAARLLGFAVLRVRCSDLPRDPTQLETLSRALVREALLFRAVPMFEDIQALAPDPTRELTDRARMIDNAALASFHGPVAATCPRMDARPVSLRRGIVVRDVPLPPEWHRAELWRRALAEQAPDLDFDRAAARYPITGGLIQRAAASASALALARGEAVTDADIHAGLRSALDVKLSTLGVRVTWRQTWDDLVLPDDSISEVREFIARVRHRRRVYDEWGFKRKLAKGLGLSALFSGPPGTGKTMVAGIIADELNLDLYQIDLSRIVSKYVGETEKNLANLFDAAEAGHAILLFDEADSLFAKRTEVQSSVNRYANLEVNYLLQRMEAFNGITILTTNLDSSIDDAFRRRLSFRVNFPMPEPEDRERLWKSMLPSEAQVDGEVDFELLSDKYEMSGGYIRNAVLRAAFLAADEDSAITMGHLRRAANLEYVAMGKVISSFSA